jgi:hypothetical protein
LVKLGDWSYSIYLWHWPFIVFAIYLGVDNSVTLGLVALVSFAPALASFYWVENPIRAKTVLSRPKFMTLVGAVVAVPVATALVVTFALQPTTLHEGDLGTDYLSYIDRHSFPCSLQHVTDSSFRCRQSQPDTSVQVAMIGDSHAEDLFPGLMDARPETNISYMYWPNWPFTTSDASKAALEEIAVSPSIKSVVIGARWTPEGSEVPLLQETVTRLTKAGKQVFIADGRPYFSFHPRECKYQRLASILIQRCEEDSAKILRDFAATSANISGVVSPFPSASLLETASGFCTPGSCTMLQNGKVLMADQGHLNVLGSRYVANRLLGNDEAFASSMKPVLNPEATVKVQ